MKKRLKYSLINEKQGNYKRDMFHFRLIFRKLLEKGYAKTAICFVQMKDKLIFRKLLEKGYAKTAICFVQMKDHALSNGETIMKYRKYFDELQNLLLQNIRADGAVV